MTDQTTGRRLSALRNGVREAHDRFDTLLRGVKDGTMTDAEIVDLASEGAEDMTSALNREKRLGEAT